jgi:hypothetical protein
MNNFFATLYELIIYINGFSNDMYEANAYMDIGLIMLITSLILILVYYYFISNYGVFYKKIYWFIWLLIIGTINFFSGYYISEISMQSFYSTSTGGSPYSFTEHFTFSMVNVLWAIIFSFLFSIVLKIKSITASKTPF